MALMRTPHAPTCIWLSAFHWPTSQSSIPHTLRHLAICGNTHTLVQLADQLQEFAEWAWWGSSTVLSTAPLMDHHYLLAAAHLMICLALPVPAQQTPLVLSALGSHLLQRTWVATQL